MSFFLAKIIIALACVIATALVATMIGLALRPVARRDDPYAAPFGDQPHQPWAATRSKMERLP